MDKEKAIQILKRCEAESYCNHYKQRRCCIGCGQRDALDLAIEALGQTASEDCISRADLIESFLADNECEREEAKACMCSLDLMLELIEDAPSAIPTERTGEWIGSGDGYWNGELVYDTWECSECGYTIEEDDTDLLPKYCRECGAKMGGDTE